MLQPFLHQRQGARRLVHHVADHQIHRPLRVSGLLAASDQAVKWLVQQSMAYGESISVTHFNWVHLWNTGAAFSLFANGGGWQRYFFIGLAVAVSIFLIKLILENRHKGEAIAYSSSAFCW